MNKNLHFMKPLFFITGILMLIKAYSQEIPCATEVSREYAEEMKKSLPEFELFKESFQKNMSSASRISSGLKKNSIPIKITIVRDNNGVTTLDTADLRKGINFMNKAFENSGLEFYVCGSYNYINSSTYYILDNTEFESLNNTYGSANIINLYFVNQIAFYGSSAIGVAPTPGGSLWVILRNNADSTVYPHEMGHFFGLLHTHGYSNSVKSDEFVDGSNCHEAGDYFCDTPADPMLSPAIVNGTNVNAQCNYTGNLKDGHYQTYVPDATNIMSYAPARCLSHFSNEQLAYMNWVYINRRQNLTCSSINVNFNTNTVMACDSPYVYNFVKQTSGVTNLQWDVNDDGITDYTTNNPTHTYTSSGIKWVSLSGTAAGKTYMRYKPIEFVVPYKIPKFIDFNSSAALPNGWRFYNPDNARCWDIISATGTDGQLSNVLRYKNYNYVGYEEEDGVITNAYDLRNYKNARLTFDVAYAPNAKSDTLVIYASTDCGNTYPFQILKISGQALQTHARQFHEFVPGEDDWKNVVVSLNSYVNNFVSFKIINYNMGGNNLYIDNIRVEGGDSTVNEIGFVRTLINTSENSSGGQAGCRGYRMLSVPVFISTPPTSSVTVNVTATGSAAVNYDFELINNQLVFPAGQTGNQIVQVKIMDDATYEPTETIQLSLTIQGVTNYRTTSKSRTTSIQIFDNDPVHPDQKIFSKVLLDEKFETYSPATYLPVGWSQTNNFYTTASLGIWLFNPDDVVKKLSLDSTNYIFLYGDVGSTHPPSSEFVETPAINISDFDSLTVELDHWQKLFLPDCGDISIDFWNGTTWVNKYYHGKYSGEIGGDLRPEHLVLNTTGFTNTDFKVRFGIVNEISGYFYFLDNVKITGFKTKAKVATVLNSSATAYLGPNEKAHFYDPASGEIIASIKNLSSWNYGCTTIQIDRTGTSALPFLELNPKYNTTQKSILITPEFNNPNGVYEITLYYKNAEVLGWMSATSNSISDLGIVKSGGAIANVTPANPYANGATNFVATNIFNQSYINSDYAVTGSFSTGFSGFAGANTSFTGLLPIELIKPLQAKYNYNENVNELSWTTAQEFNCDYFEIQRSGDAIHFSAIAEIKGQGFSNTLHNYFIRDSTFEQVKNYYRFKQVDFDGTFTYSNLAMVDNKGEKKYTVEFFPNPVSNFLTIAMSGKSKFIRTYILNIFGQELNEIILEDNQIKVIDVSAFSNGVYFLKIVDNEKSETLRFIKQ